MEFRILGRLEVVEHGTQLPLGGAKQRALLALLVLHRRETISRDRLVEELWGEQCPPTAAKTIQVYISRLRKVIGEEMVETHRRGYRLLVDAEHTDIDRFQALAAEGRTALESGDARDAARLCALALAEWHGSPLEEFAYEGFAGAAIAELEEARLVTVEDRIEAELQLGRGRRLVPELQRLIDEHPLRERPIAGLMLALYRSGRHADALAVCRAARQRLDDQLGLEPGPDVRELEQRILVHDPALDAHRRPAVVSARPGRRIPVRGATSLAVLVLVVGGLLLSSSAKTERRTLDGASGAIAVDVGSGSVVAASRLTANVTSLAAGGGSLWATEPDSGVVLELDRHSGAIVDRVHVGNDPGAVVAGGGAVWVASADGGTVSRIDPESGAVTQTIQLPGSELAALAFAFGRLWAADSIGRRLFEIDPGSGAVRRTVSLGAQPSAVTAAAGVLWVAGYDTSSVLTVDPGTGRIGRRISVGDGPAALAAGDGGVWVANNLDSTVSRVDTVRPRSVDTIPVGSGPAAIAIRGATVWVADQGAHALSRIDPSSRRVMSNLALDGAPGSLTADGQRVWVGVDASATTHRGGSLTLVTPQHFGSLDPAFFDLANPPQFIGLSYDSLVTFAHSGGADGLHLVPDLAISVPRPSDGDRGYVFRLRPGIRYSDGRPLRAADFRRAIERLFRLGSPESDRFAGLQGGAACQAHPQRCTLARGIVTDDRRGTVAFHFRAPDPDFLFDLAASGFAAPIPPGAADTGALPPGTGPYRVVADQPDAIRLARNPYFHEWSQAAQPDGNPDTIVWRFVSSSDAAVAAVRSGSADWFYGLIPQQKYRQMALQAPAQLHVNPVFVVDFLPLNTHRPPFNDVRVRRALNDAIDRRHLVRMYGGPTFAAATCQPLAPGLPGYRSYCPYGRQTAGTSSSAPDLARARRLVRASGTRGEVIDLWGLSDESYVPRGVPGYIAGVLRSLGYRVRVHVARQMTITDAQRRQFQLSADGDWLAPYPDPSSYLPSFFGCHGETSNGYYCVPTLDQEMARASLLRSTHPSASAALWTAIDHRLTDDAPWVPTVSQREVDLVSRRLRNFEFNPVWGFLPDQSWIG